MTAQPYLPGARTHENLRTAQGITDELAAWLESLNGIVEILAVRPADGKEQ